MKISLISKIVISNLAILTFSLAFLFVVYNFATYKSKKIFLQKKQVSLFDKEIILVTSNLYQSASLSDNIYLTGAATSSKKAIAILDFLTKEDFKTKELKDLYIDFFKNAVIATSLSLEQRIENAREADAASYNKYMSLQKKMKEIDTLLDDEEKKLEAEIIFMIIVFSVVFIFLIIGNVIYIVKSYKQLRKVEIEALNKERKLVSQRATMIDAIGEGVYGVDKNGLCTFVNQSAVDLLGFTREEMLGAHQHELFHHHKHDNSKYIETECPIYRTLRDERKRVSSEYFITKNGNFLPIVLTVAAIGDGGAIVVFRDMTEEKLIHDAIEKERNLFSSGPVITIEWEPIEGWPIKYISSNCFEVLGYTKEQMQEKSFLFGSLIHPDDIDMTAEEVTCNIENNVDTYEQSYRLRLPNGEYKWFYDFTTLERDKKNNLTSIRGYIFDQTNLKEAEILIKNEKQKAEEANKAKSEFLANMSHEIRTPMNAIIGLTQMMFDTKLDDKQKNLISKVNSSSKMLLGIINDILDYSKIEAGKLELEHKSFELADTLSQLRVMFVDNAQRKALKFSCSMNDDVPNIVVGDEFRLTQVLVNLISNALKFTNEGSISLKIELKEKIDERNAIVSFSVNDTGIGISDEQIKKLFNPFTQADSSTTRKYGGTGLGLMISKRIVETMGSELTVQSKEGFGSTFSFCLEIAVESWKQADTISQDKQQKLPSFDNIKILLVEDNEINQEVASMMLSRIGIGVDIANNGKEGVDKYLANPNSYDLILMDLQMPIMSGYEATRIIREHDKEIPIIALSAAVMMEERQKALEAGVNDHLGKPIDMDELYGVIAKYYKTNMALEDKKNQQGPKNDDEVIDMGHLKMIFISHELIDKLLNKFLNQLEGEFLNIVEAVSKNSTDAQMQIHSLKGVSGNLGAKELYNICQTIDRKYKTEEAVSDEEIEDLKSALKRTKEKLVEPR